jgi:hypothetical protein
VDAAAGAAPGGPATPCCCAVELQCGPLFICFDWVSKYPLTAVTEHQKGVTWRDNKVTSRVPLVVILAGDTGRMPSAGGGAYADGHNDVNATALLWVHMLQMLCVLIRARWTAVWMCGGTLGC